MNVEQRLHRAVHDLREMGIEVPPLDLGSTRKGTGLRRLGAPVATVVLFALGAIAAGSDIVPTNGAGEQVATPAGASTEAQPRIETRSDRNVPRQLSALEEVAMISSLGERVAADPQSTDVDASIPPGAS